MLHVEVIKTGNEGNCYLITTDNPRFKELKTSIMVDYGGYFLEKRDYSDLCAICFSHIHISKSRTSIIAFFCMKCKGMEDFFAYLFLNLSFI